MFTGFTPETIDFLWGIRMNNNRDWFLEHKKTTRQHPVRADEGAGKRPVRALCGNSGDDP